MAGTFTDSTGYVWNWPAFTLRLTNRVRDTHGLNMRDLLKRDNEQAALRLQDDEALFAIFKDLCAAQIADRGINEESLMDIWDGTTVPNAKDALLDSFFTFSQGPKKAAAIMEKISRTI